MIVLYLYDLTKAPQCVKIGRRKRRKRRIFISYIYIYSFLEAKAMKFKHIESLFRIIRAFLNFLFLIFIIYLFIHSFIHSLLFFLPPSNTILSRLRYSITFLHPRVCPSAYWRRCRVPIVSWLELCCLASRSDSRHVITR